MSRPQQLTIRVDARLDREIRALARRERISLNQAALRLLEKGAGLRADAPADVIGDSLDHLIGTWSDDEARQLLESIESCDQIDAELWR